MNLDALLQRSDIWRGNDHSTPESPHRPTGNAELDERLGGGWPVGALTEILLDRHGIGELRLLLPALAGLPRERWQAWIAPPYIPYAPALAGAGINLSHLLWIRTEAPAEALWALEQSLRSGVCGAALGWPRAPDNKALRRLQLAAEQGEACGFLFRPRREARHPSPAAVRLELQSDHDGLTAHILKHRGGWGNRTIRLTG